MSAKTLPTFSQLRRRLGGGAARFDAPSGEAIRVLTYLRQCGATVRNVDDVLTAIQALSDEEELHAMRCREGKAVGHASDGWWILLSSDNFHRGDGEGQRPAVVAPSETKAGRC